MAMQKHPFNQLAVTRHIANALRVVAMSLALASIAGLSTAVGAERNRTTGAKPRLVTVSSGGVTSGARALTIRRQFWTNEPGTVYGYGPGNYIIGPYGILYGPYPPYPTNE
jgi:hypothetical protein